MPAHAQRVTTRGRFRSLFVSDVHLGCRYSQAESFLTLLEAVRPDHLYIVGDFIDGWRLKRRWHWQAVYVRILQRLVQLASQGTQIYYAPGNHDEFLRDFLHDFGLVTVADQFVHKTADGRRFAVLHGDQFDDVERRAKWLSVVGSHAYDGLVCANGLINRWRRWWRLDNCRFSSTVKVWAKQAVQFISDFEERLVCHAKDMECQGVICGHIHVPRVEYFGEITYCNTGDWVEHCSALVEYDTGELELVDWSSEFADSLQQERQWQPTKIEPRNCEPVTEQLAAASVGQLANAATALGTIRPASLAGLLR